MILGSWLTAKGVEPTPACDQAHCYITARKQPFPASARSGSEQDHYRLAGMDFSLPSGERYVAALPGAGMAVKYERMTVVLGRVSRAPQAAGEPDPRRVVEMIFSLTPRDKPEDNSDRAAWRQAMHDKRVFYTGLKGMWVYEGGGITAYRARVDFHGINERLLVFNNRRPDVYVEVLGYNMPERIAETILSRLTMLPV